MHIRTRIARAFIRLVAAFLALAGVSVQSAPGIARAASPPRTSHSGGSLALAPDRLADPGLVLGPGWKRSGDRAVTVVGDATGFHVLVADESQGYAWRTVATLTVHGADTPQWIGQACVTGDGRHAVVVYAPRGITNDARALGDGAMAAVVNLVTGKVTPVGSGVSIAYFDPGCGTGDQVILSQGGTGDGQTAALAGSTRLLGVDAATGRVTSDVVVPGEVTSAVPYAGRIAAVYGPGLVSIDASGHVRTLARVSGQALRLAPDAAGGLGFEVASGGRVQVHRLASGHDKTLGTARLGTVELSQVAGRVFVTGPLASGLGALPAGWRAVDAPATDTVSSTGALAVSATTPVDAKSASPLAGTPDMAQPADIAADVTVSGKRVTFTVPAVRGSATVFSGVPGPLAGAPTGQAGKAHSASRASLAPADATSGDPATTTYDPDRTCSVPRNDPAIQTYQPSAAEEEWAADQAVHGDLTDTRGPNLYQSGLAAYTPQEMFPPPGLATGGTVPAQVLLGILSQESAEYQASDHAIIGQTGNFMPSSNWYGDYGDFTYVNWADSDCGYGAGQITTGMCMAGNSNCGSNSNALPWVDQVAVAIDYQANIAAALQILEEKWNELSDARITANFGDPGYIENWYLALWDYNSGLHSDDGSGDSGLGWVNNPVNPAYPADRESFLSGNYDYDVAHPGEWNYQEKVLGYARYGLYRWNFVNKTDALAFRTGTWAGNGPTLPPDGEFCTSADNCDPANASAPCKLTGSLADHCWWYLPVVWDTNCAASCGVENLAYSPGSSEPAYPGVPSGYPADCSAPAGAVVVDDVPSSDAPALGDCSGGLTVGGSMTWQFGVFDAAAGASATYPSKIDFHQIGAGYGGHFWFTHSITGGAANAPMFITGTWTPPSSVTGWTKILVHIPNYGAWDPQADYRITPGTGQTVQDRIVNQSDGANTWVSLGEFDLSAGAQMSLSNVTAQGLGNDIAWDAAAFVSVPGPPTVDYVAMGDSYSAGEGLAPYQPDSDNSSDGCHRSATGSYADMVTMPGQTESIAQQDNAGTIFSFIACGSAVTTGLSDTAVDNPPTLYDTDGNTVWGSVDYQYGEPPQAEQGYLSPQTTLVTLTDGGDDARFSDLISACLLNSTVDTGCSDPGFVLRRHTNSATDPLPLVQFEPLVIDDLQPHLESVYTDIHTKAPDAKIVVLGYPLLFPKNPTAACGGGLGFDFNIADQEWMNQMGAQLDSVIQAAVASVASSGADIHYINPIPGFTGHDVCSSAPYINPLLLWSTSSYTGLQVPGGGSYHPTLAGQAEYADLVNECLASPTTC